MKSEKSSRNLPENQNHQELNLIQNNQTRLQPSPDDRHRALYDLYIFLRISFFFIFCAYLIYSLTYVSPPLRRVSDIPNDSEYICCRLVCFHPNK